jgi:hypothetical protein
VVGSDLLSAERAHATAAVFADSTQAFEAKAATAPSILSLAALGTIWAALAPPARTSAWREPRQPRRGGRRGRPNCQVRHTDRPATAGCQPTVCACQLARGSYICASSSSPECCVGPEREPPDTRRATFAGLTAAEAIFPPVSPHPGRSRTPSGADRTPLVPRHYGVTRQTTGACAMRETELSARSQRGSCCGRDPGASRSAIGPGAAPARVEEQHCHRPLQLGVSASRALSDEPERANVTVTQARSRPRSPAVAGGIRGATGAVAQRSRMVRSSWRSRSWSARMSISAILPPRTVKPATETGSRSRMLTVPAAPLIKAGCT